MMSPAELEA
jgi:hypothetical protein